MTYADTLWRQLIILFSYRLMLPLAFFRRLMPRRLLPDAEYATLMLMPAHAYARLILPLNIDIVAALRSPFSMLTHPAASFR